MGMLKKMWLSEGGVSFSVFCKSLAVFFNVADLCLYESTVLSFLINKLSSCDGQVSDSGPS